MPLVRVKGVVNCVLVGIFKFPYLGPSVHLNFYSHLFEKLVSAQEHAQILAQLEARTNAVTHCFLCYLELRSSLPGITRQLQKKRKTKIL